MTTSTQNTEQPANKPDTVVKNIASPPPPEPPASPAIIEMSKMVQQSIKKAREKYAQQAKELAESVPPSGDNTNPQQQPPQQPPQQQTVNPDQTKPAPPEPADDSDLPEEIRSKSKETKFNFRRAVQEQAERLAKENVQSLLAEKEKQLEELQKAIQKREEELEAARNVLKEQDDHLKLFVVTKSRDFIEAEQQAKEAKAQLIQIAERLNIDKNDATKLLTDDIINLAMAKKDIKKTYLDDGETFIEIAANYIQNYLQAEKRKKELIESAETHSKKLIEEKQKREQIERLRQEKERIETEKNVSSYVTEVIYDTTFRNKEGVEFNSKDIEQDVYNTMREISTATNGVEQLEMLATNIALAKSYERQIQGLVRELQKARQMLKTAGIKYSDPDKVAAGNTQSAASDSGEALRMPSIAELNRRIKNNYLQNAQLQNAR